MSDCWQALRAALPEHQQRIDRRRLEALRAGFTLWRDSDAARGDAEGIALRRFLAERIGAELAALEQLQRGHGQFLRRLSQAQAEGAEAGPQLLQYAAELGAGARQLNGDRLALGRWFDADALHDRYHRRCSESERELALLLRLYGLHYRAVVDADSTRSWRLLGAEAVLAPLLADDRPQRLRFEAFHALTEAVRALPAADHGQALSAATSQYIYRLAQEPRQDVWLQGEALALLDEISPADFLDVARRRLAHPAAGDDLFVRGHCLKLLGRRLAQGDDWLTAFALGLDDVQPYVRQTAAPAAMVRSWLARLQVDPEPTVRAQAALTLVELAASLGAETCADLLGATLASERHPFVLRCALHAIEARGDASAAANDPGDDSRNDSWRARLHAAADALAAAADDLRVRRWAAETAEWLRLSGDADSRRWLGRLAAVASACPPGESRRLPRAFDPLSGDDLGRLAQVLARRDFGLHFERRKHWWLRRGHQFAFRTWRWLHEMTHPSPDKRQAFRHTIGRVFRGTVHAPSAILAELSATKVPGEPLCIAEEGGWRPYLPLPDQILSAIDEPRRNGPLRIYSSAGVTTVHPPAAFHRRLRARLILTRRFAEFARLRNWQSDGAPPVDAYARALAAIGIDLRFTPYPDRQPDPSVQRFFAVGLAAGESGWTRLNEYFFSVYENNLFHLAIFVGSSLLFFTGRHLHANWQLRRARAAIPLVIGGWGTRGKSGTERLKAALFNALGYSVLSKTTGCEAMFLHAPPFRPLREMFLFRPYDKATIWEQHLVTRLAARLRVDVLLWECMALTPAFVALLQKRWMRDDLATITNTFPDHEDLQGPAGIDIPQVMTNFIPERTTLLTSEEQMRPILASAAEAAGTRLVGVGWLESGLLTPDLLARFPYQEHPDNIALTLALAKRLGIPEDFALKEMADRVVPDLGVLKVFPEAEVYGRRLSFANGMSANERFGCLSNWRRLGFDRGSPEESPDTLITTVVNNRADRVARSRVFAAILAEDLDADRHYLIGSNLQGLLGEIRDAWGKHVGELTLHAPDGASPVAVLDAQARRLRQPIDAERVVGRLRAMIGDLPAAEAVAHWREPEAVERLLRAAGHPQASAVAGFLAADLTAYGEYRDFSARLEAAGQAVTALDSEFRALLSRWFERKLVVIADYHASGDQVIHRIANDTPPGCRNRIMGIQNIKGTGLDFVYCWQAWDSCHTACQQLAGRDRTAFRQGLATLTTFRRFGLLTASALQQALAKAQASPFAQNELTRAELQVLRARSEDALNTLREHLETVRSQGLGERLALAIEGFIDAGDAMRRRERANRLYDDLVDGRIAVDRAASELLELTQRQKGGWLYRSLSEWWQRLRRSA